METRTAALNIQTGGIPVVLKLNQYDKGIPFRFTLYDGDSEFVIPEGAIVHLTGTKPDGKGFDYACSWSGADVMITIGDQVAPVSGCVVAEIVVYNGDNVRVGTANFSFSVERAALSNDSAVSDSDFPEIINASRNITKAEEAAKSAAAQADAASNAASEAAGYASKAKSSQEASAASASKSADSASAASTSEANAKASESNASKSAADAAASASKSAGLASAAHTSETNAKKSETNASKSVTDAAASADQAKAYADKALTGTPEGYSNLVTTVGKIVRTETGSAPCSYKADDFFMYSGKIYRAKQNFSNVKLSDSNISTYGTESTDAALNALNADIGSVNQLLAKVPSAPFIFDIPKGSIPLKSDTTTDADYYVVDISQAIENPHVTFGVWLVSFLAIPNNVNVMRGFGVFYKSSNTKLVMIENVGFDILSGTADNQDASAFRIIRTQGADWGIRCIVTRLYKSN